MKVYLRANGNEDIGFGHLTRMLAFAQSVCEDYRVVLVTDKLPSNFKKGFDPYVSDYLNPDTYQFYIEEAKYLASILKPEDIIVVDGYEFHTDYISELKGSGASIIKISDFAEDVSKVDVIINHGGFVKYQEYNSSFDQVFYIGPKYALIRKAFTVADFNYEKGRVLISLGGTANATFLSNLIIEILSIDHIRRIDVVSNITVPISNHRVVCFNDLSDLQMAELMGKAELVLCPASTLAYETASVGTGLIVGKLADNQNGQYEFLVSNGLAIGIGDFKDISNNSLVRVVDEYLSSDTRELNVANQKENFDGVAPNRLKKIIGELEKLAALEIRPASMDDSELLYKWVSDPDVRKNAINTSPVIFENHVKWLTSVLNDKDRLLYIVTLDNTPLAQIRFDKEVGLATISYSIDTAFRGKGYGGLVVKKGIKKLITDVPDIKKVKAVVQKKNLASNKIFESCNFTLEESTEINGIDFNIYYKA